MANQYYCNNELRRAVVRDARDGGGLPFLNGIDYLEVDPADQTRLVLKFIHPLPGQPGGFPATPPLTRQNIAIEGGVRTTGIRVLDVLASGRDLTITVSQAGDFSDYHLRLVAAPGTSAPPAVFDLQLSEIDFSFKINCPSDFDCSSDSECLPELPPEPSLDYLAKDYASFRRLMLDRLAAILPRWQERNPADVGVAIVETLAYAADQLSYYQDAVATEAYLGTARRRTSVRRHARLLDYAVHEGVNARVWTVVEVDQNTELPAHTPLLTCVQGLEKRLGEDSREHQQAINEEAAVFETLHKAQLWAGYATIDLYTWGNLECCLPRGATQAALKGDYGQLQSGDVLIFEEVLGPSNGLPADADTNHRQAVRLVSVAVKSDPIGGQFESPPVAGPVTVTEVAWRIEDALTFPMCISVRVGTQAVGGLSVAHANVVLADHGRTLKNQAPIPDTSPQSGKYAPRLPRPNLTFHAPYAHSAARQQPASTAITQDPRLALPDARLYAAGETWLPQRDLLNSGRFRNEFVLETESDGTATLRFGDNVHGHAPAGGTQFKATYRVGSGTAGNIGANAIYHVVSNDSRVTGVRNPLPAEGGQDSEALDQVRLYAPQAFRTQERAVTAEDYAAMAQRHPDVQKAVASLRWTGSWITVFITVDRKGGRTVSARFEQELHEFLERYRMVGHDIEIDSPRYVPLDLKLRVCVESGYTRASVKEALLQTFSRFDLPSGQKGFFHPDQFTFGQTIYLSQIIAAAMAVPGVRWVEVLRSHRWGQSAGTALVDGYIALGRLEIARLDNDPNRPENGKLELEMEGEL
jgi:hypothetical protein